MHSTSLQDQSHIVRRIEDWVNARQPPLPCALCGKPGQWQEVELLHLPSSPGFWAHDARFVALSCSCGHTVFLKASVVGV
jgi:hypothetical protein